MNSRKKKLAAAAMLFASVFGARKSEALNPRINTQLSGSKAATPAAAMSQGLNKATTKAATNKKSGLPTWAKWTLIGGASVVGAAAIAGTVWCCLKDKNKNPQDPNETNKSPGGVSAKDISSEVKIKARKDRRKGNILSIIEENVEGENKNESEEGDGNENAVEEQSKEEDFTIIYNTNEAKENEKKQKEAEEEAKRKAEKQENVNAFCEEVKKFEPLSKAMDSVINYGNYNKKDAINRNNGFSATYRPLQDNIEDYGKTVRIKNVGKCQNQQLKYLIKNEVGNDIDKDVCYVITLNDNSWNVVLFGDDKVAIYEINDSFYFYKYQAKN